MAAPQMTAGISRCSPWIRLVKAVLCLPIALSSGVGYILYTGTLNLGLIQTVTAMFLLACGAATLNSLQEVSVDALFERTRKRPLVTGTLSRTQAGLTATLFITLSLGLFHRTAQTATPLLLGLLGLLLYNGIYTPLKHRTGFSLLIGSIAGALPPLIGWTSAGGQASDSRALIIAMLFFLWQIPHFFTILLKHRQDYEKANIYNLASALSEHALRRITLVWTWSMSTVIFALSAFPLFLTTTARLVNITAGLLLLLVSTYSLFMQKEPNYRFLFYLLGGVFFGDMALICAAELLTS